MDSITITLRPIPDFSQEWFESMKDDVVYFWEESGEVHFNFCFRPEKFPWTYPCWFPFAKEWQSFFESALSNSASKTQ